MNDALAFFGSAIAATLGGIIAFLLLYRRKWALWLGGLAVLGAAWFALTRLSEGEGEDWALTFVLIAMFGVLPGAIGWAFGGLYGLLRSRGKAAE